MDTLKHKRRLEVIKSDESAAVLCTGSAVQLFAAATTET